MSYLLKEIRHNPLLWLLIFVPLLFAGEMLRPQAHTLLFVLSVLAIVPLAALLSHATEAVAARDRPRDVVERPDVPDADELFPVEAGDRGSDPDRQRVRGA